MKLTNDIVAAMRQRPSQMKSRHVVLTAAMCLFAQTAGAAVAHVQSAAIAGNPTSISITPHAVGNVIVVFAGSSGASDTLNISDSGGNTWGVLNPSTSQSGEGVARSWCANSKGTTATTITISGRATTWGDILIDEFSGTTCGSTDVITQQIGSGTISKSLTLAATGEAVWASALGTISGVASGFTKGADDQSQDWSEFQIAGTSSTPGFTNSGSYIALFATFKPGSGGGTPSASLSPASLAFGNVSVGATSTAQQVTLTNTGSAALSISSIGFVPATQSDFGENNACGTSLAAGATCAINVTFSPQALGSRSARLSVADNASGSPQTVSLSGSGVGCSCSIQHNSTLMWTASATTDVTSQNVYRCSGTCTPNTLIGSVGASTTTFSDPNVIAGATYSWAVRAVDPNGESASSNVATATVPSP